MTYGWFWTRKLTNAGRADFIEMVILWLGLEGPVERRVAQEFRIKVTVWGGRREKRVVASICVWKCKYVQLGRDQQSSGAGAEEKFRKVSWGLRGGARWERTGGRSHRKEFWLPPVTTKNWHSSNLSSDTGFYPTLWLQIQQQRAWHRALTCSSFA